LRHRRDFFAARFLMNARPIPPLAPAASTSPVTVSLLGTPLLVTDYSNLLELLPNLAAGPRPAAVDFCNTQIVTMRRADPGFRRATELYDYFVPDGMPLIWCLRAMGAPLRDRVYGPAFLRYALLHETGLRHYFLGGSEGMLQQLLEQVRLLSQGRFQIAGAHHGYFKPEESAPILEEINRLSPDLIWIGLGTPKQQEWVRDHKRKLTRGVVLTVGFAFDVNAGTKRDAPRWMQRRGLTWLFRMSQEPGRLGGRYLKYNTLFLFFLALDGARAFFRFLHRLKRLFLS
jgi:N-acetylglucosaminyldiphosphoundecaprenol N-acetyl-beta-D-mannosaminyltransferase